MPQTVPIALLRAALGDLEPFPWQKRLLSAFLEGAIPSSLDLPTGLGKTAVMAIWLVARACGAPGLARRLVYVVDRRAVVDQATAVAEGLAEWVAKDPSVQEALGVESLPVSTLRGRFIDNRRWLEDPAAPAIIVGTVDMIGSRLLFEGYGTSRRMRPYHAGFLGVDTLIALDEAHLVPPFQRLLTDVPRSAFWPAVEAAGGAPARLISLSATGATTATPFNLDDADRDHPVVRQRIHASKALTWRALGAKANLAEQLAAAAWELAEGSPTPRRVIIFSNKRDDAEKALAHVQKLIRGARDRKGPKPETALLVGGRRLRERTQGATELVRLGFLAGERREPLVDHVFLFTTSAGEVGVDLDADDAVMDVVAWERVVQRLGRVNRRGQGAATVTVLAHPDAEPWFHRVKALVERLPAEDGTRDASPAALAALQRQAPAEVLAASTPEPLRPALTLPLLQAWSMTSLRDHTGRPEVAPWIRGWVEDEPQTTVVWRALTPPAGHEAAYFENAPAHPLEQLEVNASRVLSWLLRRASKLAEMRDDGGKPIVAAETTVVWLLDRAGELDRAFTFKYLVDPSPRDKRILERALPGATLVVDARLGGLSAEGLLDDREAATPVTISHVTWSDDGTSRAEGRPTIPWRMALRKADVELATEPASGDWFESVRLPWKTAEGSEDVAEWLVIERYRGASASSEEGRSAGHAQTLAEHSDWTAREAARIADALDLPPRLREVLVTAARLHDAGKSAPRWQRAFSARSHGGPWAKTRGPVRPALLGGYRHELGSLPVAEKDVALRRLAPEDQALVLHLIAAHHGFARPLIRWEGCDDVPPSMARIRAETVARRFASLEATWGPWRLAWLEALLRAADQRASRLNDEGAK